MADIKYGQLVRTMTYKEGRGGANARQMTFQKGEDLAGLKLNFIVGVYDQVGDWAPNRGAHAHPFDECLFFFGYDPGDLGYLGADMELHMGKEYEKHLFSVPMVVAAPGGLAHCPLLTNKVYKPFGHFHLALNPGYAAVPVKQEGTTDGKKYIKYFKKLPVKKGPGGADAAQKWAVSGADLAGFPVNVSMGIHNKTGEFYPGKGAHTHPYDECLVFFGHDVNNPNYLGAELTIDIGKEHEKHTFNVPTAVSIPKGTPHFPIICNKVEKPYRFVQIGLGAKYESKPAD
jgi:hypothetical protein